jgi:hypothetical protein
MGRRLCIALAIALAWVPSLAASEAGAVPERAPTPVLAYYYLWFNASSWNRAKADYPLLGRYSSDERSVMERQIRWAKEVGIEGFVVSWKSTPVLDRRLRTLIDVATAEHFKLAIVYQGLDFHREPLDADKVESDLMLLAERYASAPPFQLYDEPLVVWSGTWRYSKTDVARVAASVQDSLLVLASEKSAQAYARVRGSVDGNAYYWSSGDPLRTPGYTRRLWEMGRAVHRAHGLWLAPVAPGFDARLVGGTKVVPRRDGDTLRRSLDAANASVPDALAIISWNEYSENSHVEPSESHGFDSLRVLADALGAPMPTTGDLDSSDSPATGASYGLPLLGGFVVVLLGSAALAARRRRAIRRKRGGRAFTEGVPPPRE